MQPQPPFASRDAMMACLVRIFGHSGEVVVTGFVVADGFVCTCAHVVNEARGADLDEAEAPPPSLQITLDFPGLTAAPGPPYAANVAKGGWNPIRPNESGDIAILRLDRRAPAVACPAQLVTLDAPYGRSVRAYGYPDGFDQGQHAYAKLHDYLANGNLQLADDLTTGPRIAPGYSGAALWDRDDQAHPGVVGMVARSDRDVTTKTAFAVPAAHIEAIWQADWPPLTMRHQAALEEAIRERVQCFPLPPVATVNPYEERLTFFSEIAERYRGTADRPPYVPRDVDKELDRLLREQPFVLIVGPAKSGKSRTAFEACCRVYPHSPLIIPSTPAELPQLLPLLASTPLEPAPALLWLDDLEWYLDAGALTTRALDLAPIGGRRVVVVATIRSEQYRRRVTTAAGENAPGTNPRGAGALLQRVQVHHGLIELPLASSRGEADQAHQLYPGMDFTLGIATHLTATDELLRWFRDGEGTAGYALVRAAIDWRRTGMPRLVTESELRQLYHGHYRRTFAPLADGSAAAIEQGLLWASQRVTSGAALLQLEEDEGTAERHYQVFDAVVSSVDQEAGQAGYPLSQTVMAGASQGGMETIPETIWGYVLERATPNEQVVVAVEAWLRDRENVALQAAQLALADGLALAPANAMELGKWLELWDSDQAPEAYRLAVARGNAGAAYSLGEWHIRTGHPEQAREAWRQGMQLGSVEAAGSLGQLLSEDGDLAGAAESWRQAMALGSAGVAPELARVLIRLHDVAGAEAALRQGMQMGTAGSAEAANHLGWLLKHRGNLPGALEAWQRAVTLGSGEAATTLGLSYWEQGDAKASERSFAVGIRLGSHTATYHRGRLRLQQGDEAGALKDWTWGEGYLGNAACACGRGMVLLRQGDRARARRALRHGMELGHTEAAFAEFAEAAFQLGELFRAQGAVVEAQDAFHAAMMRGSDEAAMALGRLLVEQGDPVKAAAAYRLGLAGGRSDAAFHLGVLLVQQGESVNAAETFRLGMEMGIVNATRALGDEFREGGYLSSAQERWRHEMEAGSAEAAFQLGALLREQGERSTAHERWRHALRLGIAEAAAVLQVFPRMPGDPATGLDAWLEETPVAGAAAAALEGEFSSEPRDLAADFEAWIQDKALGSAEAAYHLGVFLRQEEDKATAAWQQLMHPEGTATADP
jgi:tetratricopeptide (TPR) repeat protein